MRFISKLFTFSIITIILISISNLVSGITYLHQFPVIGSGNTLTGSIDITSTEYYSCYGVAGISCWYDLWCKKSGYVSQYYNNWNPYLGGYLSFSSIESGSRMSLYGQVGCLGYVTCDASTYFEEQGKCCNVMGTMNTAGDPQGRCCYKGITYPSDSLTADGLYICYESQLYGKKDPVISGAVRLDDGCTLREAGSKYYFNQLNLEEPWKFDGDTNEEECSMCGVNTWNVDLSTEQCCGDDGYGDTGRVLLENTLACYKGLWLDTRKDIDRAFKIFTAEDLNNNQLFEYDIISTGDYWHTCDANGLVPNIKESIQLNAGGYLISPNPTTYVVESSVPSSGAEQQTTTSIDWQTYLDSEISTTVTESTQAGTPVTTVIETSTIDNSDIAARFVCAKEDTDSRFLECCPDSDVCINKENNRYRLPGSFLNTIKEFTSSIGTPGPYGWGLKTSFIEEVYTLQIFLNSKEPVGSFIADSKLNDWSSFDYLEFFIYAVDDLNLELYIGGEKLQDTTGYFGSHYSTLFNQPILTPSYSSNGVGLKKWITVRVPISEIQNNNNINIIEFRASKSAAMEDGGDFSINNINYHNLIFIDKIHLVKEGNDFVCSGEEYNPTIRPNLWINELDNDITACQSIPGYTWSGTRCCGDDINEYYKDGENYCWNGNLLEPNTAVSDFDINSEDADILYSENGLLSCSDSRTSVTHGNFSEIVNPVGLLGCNIFGNYVCSPNGKWSKELYGLDTISERSVTKFTFDNSESVCCASIQCWTGKKCIDASSGIQETTSLDLLAGGNWGDEVLQACVLDATNSGEWLDIYMSEKWDSSSLAYCPEENTCWDGEKCVFENTFSNDFYCKLGSWSTRTKILATKLLQQAQKDSLNDFSLYCDIPQNTLPYIEYPELSNFLLNGGANNFCVLKTSDDVITGTSLNEGQLDEFANLVNLNCNEINVEGDVFGLCINGNNQLWYNPEYNLVIYAKDGVFIDDLSGNQLFSVWFNSPIDTTIELISSVIKPIIRTLSGTIEGEDFIKEARDFNRLFIAKLDNKEILGIAEQVDPDHSYFSIEYKGFKTDVCRFVDKPNIFCQPIITSETDTYADYRLFTFGKNLFGLEEIWQLATSALRLESKTFTSFSSPSAVIESPQAGQIFYHNDDTLFKVLNPQEDVTYYWDADSTDIFNGEIKGNSYSSKAYLVFNSPGPKVVTLIAVDKDGKFSTSQVNVIKN